MEKNLNKMTSPSNNENQEIDDKTAKDIENLLDKLSQSYNKKRKKRDKKNLNVHTLNSLIEEYLNTYLVIGYDINDNYVQLSNLSTQGEVDKIQSGIHRVLRYGATAKTDIGDYDEDFEE